MRPVARRGRPLMLASAAVVLLLGGATLAIIGLGARPSPGVVPPSSTDAVASVAPIPAPPQPSAPPIATPTAATQPARRVPASSNRSRTWDFDAYLARSGRDAATLTAAERRALFDEFLATRSRVDAPSAPAPRAGPRVVLHVPAGSAPAEALSGRLLASLGTRPGTVEARHVAATPSRPNIRYFYPDDAATAQQVAGWLAEAGLSCVVRDFSGYQPSPSRGTIEVWLPR